MKKYKLGYTAGAFDLFHIGHLNLLEAAKEHCDFLIVGVNHDELIQQYKNKIPMMSMEERLEIIRALKVVDRAEIVTTLDKIEIHKSFKFDVAFIGSDWKGSTRWNETEEKLKEINVDTIYLDYTKGISSTMISKKLIESKAFADGSHKKNIAG